MKTQSCFSQDEKEYSTKDPDKIALLQSLGAVIIRRDISDPQNIVFTLRHDKIAEYVYALHNGTLDELGQNVDPQKVLEFRREIIKFIRDVKLNAKQQGGQHG
jgi:hypothetical protein